MLPDAELGLMLMRTDDPKKVLAEMVSMALRRGGPDNATAVAVFIDSI